MKIHIVGADERLKVCAALLEKAPPRGIESIRLLPIPASRDGLTVTGTKETVEEIAKDFGAGEAVVAYGANAEMRSIFAERGVLLLDPSRDEKYISANAELTAVGAIGRILTEERAAPCQLSVGVIGYGRIGSHLVRCLMFLGATVRVFTSKSELRRDLQMLGVSGVDSCSLSDGVLENLGGLDLLINTAPASLLPDEAASVLEKTRVIELASGKNLPEGIKSESWQSVPAAMYPESAGRELYLSVIRMLG